MEQWRLEQIEQHVFDFFREQRRTRILAKELFVSNGDFANADLVRALEDLEKRWRFLVRYTKAGNDYISLTPEGAASLGLNRVDLADDTPIPHPPKSATKSVS